MNSEHLTHLHFLAIAPRRLLDLDFDSAHRDLITALRSFGVMARFGLRLVHQLEDRVSQSMFAA